MSRARFPAALALVAALAACNDEKTDPQAVQLSRPSSVAAFRGVVFGSPEVRTYIAIANEARNDISIVNAGDDSPVLAQVSMRTLVVPVLSPKILVSTPLGDEGSPATKADLLVAVSAGDSRLQLVRTWSLPNDVVDEVTPVDFGADVLDAIAIPAAEPNRPRIAVALAGGRVGIATYRRSGDGTAIEAVGVAVSASLGFQPVALAAMPGETDHVYAATRDPIPTTGGIFGVAEIEVVGALPTDPPSFAVRALDARAPTRLVAAASLRERIPGSTAQDDTAFGPTAVPRVYAVLDESACGMSERIGCGVAVLDPASGLLGDLTGRMPYLAPIPLPSRPVAIAVSQAPASPPPSTAYTGDLMRLWPASGELTTTAVAAVPCEDGRIYFLDLSRWKVANDLNAVASVGASATSTSLDVKSSAGVTLGNIRLWVANATTGEVLPQTATADDVRKQIGVTPGWTRSETFTVGYQAALPLLGGRRSAIGRDASGLWLSMAGGAGPIVLGDPALGVRVDDIVAVDVAGLPDGTGCVGTDTPGAAAGSAKIFEARVAELLAPAADYLGGAVRLRNETADPVPAPADATGVGEAVARWATCMDGLAAKLSTDPVANGLTASIRAGGYAVSSDVTGYLGRPVEDPGVPGFGFVLEYPSGGEDGLAGDELVLARKSRRSYHVAEPCDEACTQRWDGAAIDTSWLANPESAGPLVEFRFGLQPSATLPAEPRRGLSLSIATSSGVSPFDAGNASGQGALVQPNGATVFDRSTLDPSKGYRFLVPYAGDFVIDTSPSLAGGDPVAIH